MLLQQALRSACEVKGQHMHGPVTVTIQHVEGRKQIIVACLYYIVCQRSATSCCS